MTHPLFILETSFCLTGGVVVNPHHRERLQEIEYLQRIGDSVQARVVKVVGGGLRVDVGVPAFLPQSLIEDGKVKDLECYVGQVLDVLIDKCDIEHSNVVVSRRAYLLRARKIQADKTLARTKVGDICRAEIMKMNQHGIFIRIDGVDALVHVLNVSWDLRPGLAHDYRVGQHVDVKVLKIDLSERRMDATIRGAQANPWKKYEHDHFPGQLVWCKAVSVLPHGAYFELADGVYGFAHVSELSERIVRQATDVLSVGDEHWMKITAHDKNAEYHDIGLRLFPDLFKQRSTNRTPFSHFNSDGTPKVKYRTYADADETIRRMYQHGHNGNLLYSYKCSECAKWHFGGTSTERWTLSKVRAELEGGIVAPEWAEHFSFSDNEQ